MNVLWPLIWYPQQQLSLLMLWAGSEGIFNAPRLF